MPELNGLEAARQIRKACPNIEVLILTMHESESLVRDLLAAGVRGFVLKTDTARLLVSAVETIAQNKPVFHGQGAPNWSSVVSSIPRWPVEPGPARVKPAG